ncbi:hypothetical protein COO60DRAFT_1103334 [Scenedesmus sp. NREL 46B-D3]|nr:hypothetical protein COO60DRAFT_1103334 [Scenedesmus sp. NREL 46B-D3]
MMLVSLMCAPRASAAARKLACRRSAGRWGWCRGTSQRGRLYPQKHDLHVLRTAWRLWAVSHPQRHRLRVSYHGKQGVTGHGTPRGAHSVEALHSGAAPNGIGCMLCTVNINIKAQHCQWGLRASGVGGVCCPCSAVPW